ncbi:MAG: hypothetical protein AAGA90_09600 [Actinomycetota bacterium]
MRVTPRFDQIGSMKAGTVKSRLLDIETVLDIESPAPTAEVRELVAIAENMCFMIDTIREPHDVRSTTTLNGERLD